MKMFDSIAKDLIRQKAKEREAERIEAERIEAEKSLDPELEVHTTKPMESLKEYTTEPVFNPASKEGKAQTARRETRGRKPLPRIICPFCEEERKQNGVSTHIRERHGVPGVSVQDLLDVQNGIKSLEDLVYEKFGDDAEIDLRNLSDRVSKEEFGSWDDIEDEDEAADEAEADPVEKKPVAQNNPIVQKKPVAKKRWYDRIRPFGFEDSK